MSHCTVYVTAPDRDAALAIARALIEARLIACANVIDGATSVYRWEGKVEEAREAVMLLKTISPNVSAIIDMINKIHDYSCPCVTVWPIVAGNPDYLAWVDSETTRT